MAPDQTSCITSVAAGVKALVRAARRAHERGDRKEYGQLMDEADEQVALMIYIMPDEKRGTNR